MIKKEVSMPGIKDKELVAQLWEDEACPYFDLVMFSDGRLFKLDMSGSKLDDAGSTASTEWVRISDVPEIDIPDEMNEGFASLYQQDIMELGISVSVGECCASGENGFVAVTSIDSRELRWLAFFLASNPFDQFSIENGELVAISTSNEKYRFPLNRPEMVRVD